MKRLFNLVLAVVLSLLAVFSFGCGATKPQGSLTMYAPDGAPALAISKFINDDETFGVLENVEYKVVSASTIGAQMITGNADIIVLPVTAASKLYKANKDDPYKLVSVVTHGNLYVMSDKPTTLDQLKGQVVGVIGQGQVPDVTFKGILKNKNIEYVISETAVLDKVAIRYFDDASTMLPLLKKGVLSTGLLPEPAATKLTTLASDKTWYRLDVQKEYDQLGYGYPQAVMMVKSSVIEKHPTLVAQIQYKFVGANEWVKANIEKAVQGVQSTMVIGNTSLDAKAITPEVVANCRINWQGAYYAKHDVNEYIKFVRSIDENCANEVANDFFNA